MDEADSNSQSSQSISISANASPINNRSKKDKETEKDWYDSEEEDLKEDAKGREATMKRAVQTRAMLCLVCRWDRSEVNKDKDPLDQDTLRMEVSLTNRRDLRSYVVASLIVHGTRWVCVVFGDGDAYSYSWSSSDSTYAVRNT